MGSEWFRELGTRGQPGSMLLTLSGAIEISRVYEIEHGAPLENLIEAAGGARSDIKAGCCSGLLRHLATRHARIHPLLSAEQLAPYGAGLGPHRLALSEDAAASQRLHG